ncbi:hypothetical protein Tco_1468355 [Tanacetum coccineum]
MMGWDKLEESYNEIFNMVRSFCEMVIQRKQAANISTHTPEPSRHFNFTCDDDDDDEEYSIPLKDMPQISPSIALVPVSSIMEPEDSLIMGNEELSTIPEKESDEFIKSSVEDLIPIPRESEDSSGSDSESVLPSSDDFSPIFEEKSMTFSNPLFNSNDFTFSDNELLSDEDVSEDVKIYSNPLLKFDNEYISNDVNPLFDEVLENIESKDSYVSNLDESALLVTPLSDANEDECFDPGGVIDEIDAFLDIDISTDIENGYHDSEGGIIYLECLLIDDTSPNLPPEVFLDHVPRSLKDEPDNNDLMTEDKVFDPGIYEKSFSPTFVKLTFEDRHYFPITFVIRIFLPYLTYSVDSSFLLSSGSEDTIFDPALLFIFSSLKPVAYENRIVIFPFLFLDTRTKDWEKVKLRTRQKQLAQVTAGKPRGTTQVVTRGLLMIRCQVAGTRYCSSEVAVRGGDVTPPKMCRSGNMSGALLHNTTAQDTRERPLNMSFENRGGGCRGVRGDDGVGGMVVEMMMMRLRWCIYGEGGGSVERVVDEWRLVVLVLAVGGSEAGDDEGDGVGMAVVARDVRPWSRWWLWVGMKMMVDMGCFGVGDGCGAWPESWLDKNGGAGICYSGREGRDGNESVAKFDVSTLLGITKVLARGGEVMEKRVARCGCGGSGAVGGDDDYRDGDEGGIVVVAESEYGDRVDPVVRTTFGVRRKIPPEKFSGGGGRNPVGEGGMRGERERVDEDVSENQLLSISLLICPGNMIVRKDTFDENLGEINVEKHGNHRKFRLAQGQKEWDNPPNIISEQEVANLKAQAKRLFRNEDVWVEMHRGIAWNKVENSDLQSTPQVLPSFEEYTPHVTCPEEVEETLGNPIEVEPLNETKLEDSLNTCKS